MGFVFHLLGVPYVEINHQKWIPPIRKVEGLIYYLLRSGPTSREQLADLFWGERDEASAQNNLRNALYLARRALPELIQVERRLVSIQRDAKIVCDLDEIDEIANLNREDWQDLCREFLYGFCIPESEGFTSWLRDTRRFYKDKILEALRLRISRCYEEEEFEKLGCSLKTLVQLDSLDEDSVLELMEFYVRKGEINQAIELFVDFRTNLMDQLGIDPSPHAEDVFRRLIFGESYAIRTNEKSKGSQDFFWGRQEEIRLLVEALSRNYGSPLVLSISGEAGVGKTALVKKIFSLINSDKNLLLLGTAYDIGKGSAFSPWNDLVRSIASHVDLEKLDLDPVKVSLLSAAFPSFSKGHRISTTREHLSLFGESNPAILGELFAEVLERLAGEKRIFLCLEDLQSFDEFSMELLETLIICLRSSSVFLITSRIGEGEQKRSRLSSTCRKSEAIFLEIPLYPFSADESHAFGEAILKDKEKIQKIDKVTLYKETGGLPLFLVELFKSIKEIGLEAGMKGRSLEHLILERLNALPDEQRKVLEGLSIFEEGISVEFLANMLEIKRSEMLHYIEVLMRKGLLEEKVLSDSPTSPVRFHHDRVRETVYLSLNSFKKTELHYNAAEKLQRQYDSQPWDPDLSMRLLYHYDCAGLTKKSLGVRLQEMRTHIILNNELFPLLPDKILLSCITPFSDQKDTEKRLEQVLDLLHDLNRSHFGDIDLLRMEAAYLELRGGYLIAWGNYREGRQFINRALTLSRKEGFEDIYLRSLLHVCYHFLQTDNAVLLESTAREMLHLARQLGLEFFVATALRFLGVSKQLSGDFQKAKIIYEKSVKMFSSLEQMGEKYTIPRLAALNYIAEIAHWEGRFEEALALFEKCAQTAEENSLFWGCSLFHANAGNVAFDIGNFEKMDRHVDRAVEIFEHGRGGRSGSLPYSLKALCEAKRGHFLAAIQALERSEALCLPIQKASWTAPHLMAKAYLAEMAFVDKEAGKVFTPFLRESPEVYAKESMVLYNRLRVFHRVEKIQKKFNLC